MDVSKTTTALLDGLLADSNETLWCDFAERYRPIIVGWAHRMGISHEDAADVAQETLMRLVSEYRAGNYERERGRLRSWIFAIARARLIDLHRARGARVGDRGDSVLAELGDEDRTSLAWEEEWRHSVTQVAMDLLRRSSDFAPATIQAFQLYALDGRTVAEAAESLGMTIRSVYMAKHQCVKRLRALVEDLEAVYER